MCGVMIGTSPRLLLIVQMCGVMIGTSPRLSLIVQMCGVMIDTSPRLSLIVQMCGVMIGGFLVCWTPYAIISALSMCGVGMSTQVATLPTMFAKLSCALNPAIYVLMSSKFREAVGALAPWSHNSQHRHTRTTIELSGEPKL